MSKYGQLTDDLIIKLGEIVGKEHVSAQIEDREKYACDEMAIPKPYMPDVVVKPSDIPSVAKILTLANKERIPVTPRGGGTGLSGGAVPVWGGILLSLERMDRIIEIDEQNFVVVVEAGVPLSELYQAVGERGLYYPVYFGAKSATVGGTIATNAGGMRAVKYGVTRHFVLGLTAVLPSGQIIETGGKFVKCTSGYDLTQFLIGSEGTLAVITRAILRLIAPPGRTEVLFIPFTAIDNAINAVSDILKQGIPPAGIEFMERDIIELVEDYIEKEIPFHEYPAFLMVILEVDSEGAFHKAARNIHKVTKKHGAIDVFLPPGAKAKRELLEAREKFYYALKHAGAVDIADTVVPRGRIPEFLKAVKEISAKHGIPIVAYGHAGDGNVHLHPLGRGMDKNEWERKLPEVFRGIYQVAIALGGAISGEHGIGFDKKAYFTEIMDKNLMETMMKIKRVLDPNNILNPGKIFSSNR